MAEDGSTGVDDSGKTIKPFSNFHTEALEVVAKVEGERDAKTEAAKNLEKWQEKGGGRKFRKLTGTDY